MKPTSAQQRLINLRYAVLMHVQSTHEPQVPSNMWGVVDAVFGCTIGSYLQKHPLRLMGWVAIVGASLLLTQPWQYVLPKTVAWLQSKSAQSFYRLLLKKLHSLKESP